MEQAETRYAAEEWSAYLSHALDRAVLVEYGRARRQVVVAHIEGRTMRLRLNEQFAGAPPAVREALASWLRSGRRARRACAVLDAFIEELAERFDRKEPRRTTLRPHGLAHDLQPLLHELRATEFPPGSFAGAGVPDLTWGRRGPRRVRHTIQLGSYEARRRLVRIHPVLDQPAVPRFFVRTVLHHELLHAALPSHAGPRGRHVHHGPEFRRREEAYCDYERSQAWQEEHLAALLRSARTGRPLPRTRRRTPVQWVQGLLFPGEVAGGGRRG